jgi:hypothetical protein
LKGVRNMLESRVSKPGVRWAALSSYVAGVTGILANRWLRASGALPPLTARFGESMGVLVLAAGAVAGPGLLLPWMSLPQLILFGAGGVLAVIGGMGTPFWSLFLGRYLGRT